MHRALLCCLGLGLAAGSIANANDKTPVATVDIVGKWSGEWGPFNPSKATAPDPAKCKGLDCIVVENEGVWEATFEGECGRPYKYTIRMEGRRSGDVVLFQGSTDLGEQDGGVHDWIGRADSAGFIGFYTSSHHTGFFRLKPASSSPSATEPASSAK